MTKIEPTALDLARASLLSPFGLDEPALERVFGLVRAHRCDEADLYFQLARAERPATCSSPSLAATTSRACLPIDPVEPIPRASV